jgi:hypothetical protein
MGVLRKVNANNEALFAQQITLRWVASFQDKAFFC